MSFWKYFRKIYLYVFSHLDLVFVDCILSIGHSIGDTSQGTTDVRRLGGYIAGNVIEAEADIVHLLVGIRQPDTLDDGTQLDNRNGHALAILQSIAAHHFGLVGERINRQAEDLLLQADRHFARVWFADVRCSFPWKRLTETAGCLSVTDPEYLYLLVNY